MATITMNIPLPVLSTGQHFKTRYRTSPSGSWSSYVNRTNAPFSLTGLSAGNYQLEVILVNADSSECAAVYKNFSVVEDFECIDFEAAIVLVGNLYYLSINYTLPGGFTNPSCGWDITYATAGGPVTTHYAALPVSGNIKILVANVSTVLQIRANLCDGNYKECHLGDVPPLSTPCQPIVITDAKIVNLGGVYKIILYITNSIPATSFAKINYVQNTQMQSGYQPDSGTLNNPGPLTLTPTFSFTVHPNPWQGNWELPTYRGNIEDACGKGFCWQIILNNDGTTSFKKCS